MNLLGYSQPANMPYQTKPKRNRLEFECDAYAETDESAPVNLALDHFTPRLCGRLCPDGSVCTGSPKSDGSLLYACTGCGYGPTRMYRWPLDPDEQKSRIAAVSNHFGSTIAIGIVRTLDPDPADHCSGKEPRFLDADDFDHSVLKAVAVSMKQLMDVLNALLAHTDPTVHVYAKLSKDRIGHQMREFCWAFIDHCPLTFPDALELIAMQMALGNVHDAAILGWTVHNFVMFTHDESRGIRLLTALKKWHDARQQLLTNCSFTTLCHEFIDEVGYDTYTCLTEPNCNLWSP